MKSYYDLRTEHIYCSFCGRKMVPRPTGIFYWWQCPRWFSMIEMFNSDNRLHDHELVEEVRNIGIYDKKTGLKK